MPWRKDNNRTRRLIEAAAEWFVRGRARLRPRQRRWYLRWLRLSRKHVAETLRLQQLEAKLRIALRGMTAKTFCGEENDPYFNVIEIKTRQPVSSAGLQPAKGTAHRSIARHWKMAASIAGIMLVSLIAAGIDAAWRGRLVETVASEWRTVRLTDGSIVRVGPHSRLHFDFGDDRRVAYLNRGEAYFDVAKDPARPFVVRTEPLSVRAVGTAFGVARRGKRVVVTVDEGVVAVTRDEAAKKTKAEGVAVPVSAGEQLEVSDAWPVAARRVDVTRELDWARGRLIFGTGDTMEVAVNEFNQRNRVQIVLSDPQLRARQVRGVFLASDPETFAMTVAKMARVEVVRGRRGELRILVEGGRGAVSEKQMGERVPPP